MKKVGAILIVLGLILVIINFSSITGAVIGTNFKTSYLLFSGILLFIIGAILALSESLENVVESESRNPRIKKERHPIKAVYNAGRELWRHLYYGAAAPVVSSVIKTGKETAKEGVEGMRGTAEDIGRNKAFADAYRAVSGRSEGWLSRLNPVKNADYAKRYQELSQFRYVLSQSAHRRVSMPQAYHELERLKSSRDSNDRAFYDYFVSTVQEPEEARKKEQTARDIYNLEHGNAKYGPAIKYARQTYGSRRFRKEVNQHLKRKAREK